MNPASSPGRTITVARRALIVQRVLVDGWTSAETAAAFDVSEQLVDAWVADYRRHGMMSLRRVPGQTVVVEIIHVVVSRPLGGAARRIANGLRRLLVRDRPAQPLPLRRSSDDSRGGE
jgi:transposase-like protein